MTFKALIAAVVSVIFLWVGIYLTLTYHGATIGDYVTALLYQGAVPLRCFLFAIGALLAAACAVFSCFFVFREDEDGYEESGFPFIAIPFFLVAALVLFWFAIACARTPEAAVLTPAVVEEPAPLPEPQPEPEPEPIEEPLPEPVDVLDLAGEADPVEEIVDVLPPEPEISAFSNAADWPYKYPLVRDGAYVPSGADRKFLTELFPLDDPDGAVRAFLCSKAWVAIAGASSEEGPQLRNHARARIRARLAIERARDWLDHHADNCEAPALFGIDLGQHIKTGAAATAYQRQVLFLSRPVHTGQASLTSGEAMSELATYLDDPASRSVLLSGRSYDYEPQPFEP